MIILSIDPGYDRVGFSVIEKEGENNKLIYSECFETERKNDFYDRLYLVGKRFEELIKKHKPDVVAIEKIFFASNKKTGISVSNVIGSLIYISRSNNIKVLEYTPKEVKLALTGDGSADKDQIHKMLKHFVDLEEKKAKDDEYDSIAVGITCSAMISNKQHG